MRANIKNGYLPLPTDVLFEGIVKVCPARLARQAPALLPAPTAVAPRSVRPHQRAIPLNVVFSPNPS